MITVLHLHTRAGMCSICNNPVAFMLTTALHCTARRWFLILFGVISDVTVNKDVGYQMYDDVDDSYNLWYHQFILEMY